MRPITSNSFAQSTVSKSAFGLFALSLALTAAPMSRTAALNAQEAAPAASGAPTPASCGLSGHHALLERMAAAFSLTCDQILKIEPLLHDEESVSKPLIAFGAFSADEKKAVMQEMKLAARKQILPLLTPDQQAKMNQEIDTVSKGGEGLQAGNGGGGKKNAAAPTVDPFQAEQSLADAISKYAAFTDDQKRDLILKVRQASLRPDAPQMTPDQVKQVQAELNR
jgi:Spy/CpxP family protein refolding chaperone